MNAYVSVCNRALKGLDPCAAARIADDSSPAAGNQAIKGMYAHVLRAEQIIEQCLSPLEIRTLRLDSTEN